MGNLQHLIAISRQLKYKKQQSFKEVEIFMQIMLIRISLVLTMLALINPFSSSAVSERRLALVIGNGSYMVSPLRNPVNDATDMASSLKKLGFNVILRTNASKREMGKAIEDFGKQLKGRDIGLFYYAGHGVQVNGMNYLMPVGAKINEETDVEYEAVDAGRVLATMNNAKSSVNIVILDACRDNPYARSFRSTTRGLAIIAKAPSGTIISYSTSPGDVALDGKGRNSPYTSSLIQYMKEPGLSIEQVFKNVRQKLNKETNGRQVPWELSSLQGDFFFVLGVAGTATESVLTGKQPVKQKPAADEPVDELELAMAKIQRQQEDKAAQKAEREEKFRTFLADVKKYKTIAKADIDAATKAVAWKALIRKYPSWSTGLETGQADEIVLRAIAGDTDGSLKKIAIFEGFSIVSETSRDGRFIAFDNGTVLDTRTKLMWVARDNGSDINWRNAKSYCENYRGGGYTDWRMPTQDELAGLYDESKPRPGACQQRFNIHVATSLIDITCHWVWSSEMRGSEAVLFRFIDGKRNWWREQSGYDRDRALPVRSSK